MSYKGDLLHFISFVQGRKNPCPQPFLTTFAKLRTLCFKAFFTFFFLNFYSAMCKKKVSLFIYLFVSVFIFFLSPLNTEYGVLLEV